MTFSKEFLTGRARHLVAKLRATKESFNRIDLPKRHLDYKTKDLIPKIESAIKRLELGTYGICTHCENPIPEQRLLIQPHVPRCVSCEETHEPKKK